MKKTIKIIFVLMFISLAFTLSASEVEAWGELLKLKDVDGQLGIKILASPKARINSVLMGVESLTLKDGWFVGSPTTQQIENIEANVGGWNERVADFLKGPYIDLLTSYSSEKIDIAILEELVVDNSLKVIKGKLSVSGKEADIGNLLNPKLDAWEIAVGNCVVKFSSTTKKITFEDEGYFRRKIKGVAESYEAEVIDGEKSGLVVDYNYEGGFVTKKLYESLFIRGKQDFIFIWQPMKGRKKLEPWDRIEMKNMASWLEIDSMSKKDDNKLRLYSKGNYLIMTEEMARIADVEIDKGEKILNITKEGLIILSLGGVSPTPFGLRAYTYVEKVEDEVLVNIKQPQYLCSSSNFEGIRVEQLVEKTELEIDNDMALAEQSSSLVQQLAEGISKEEVRVIKSYLLEYASLKNRETSFTEICQLHNLGCDEVKQIGAEKKEIESEWSLFAPIFALIEKLPSPISTVVEKNDVKILQPGSAVDAYEVIA